MKKAVAGLLVGVAFLFSGCAAMIRQACSEEGAYSAVCDQQPSCSPN